MLKTITNPVTHATLKMGRIRPSFDKPRLQMSNYMGGVLPAPPATSDYSKAAANTLTNIYGNDQLGDCVIAAGAHVRGVTSANAGKQVTFTQDQIIGMYSAIGGYVPGNPNTDQGADPQVAIDYWTKTGFPDGVKLAGVLQINPLDPVELKTAVWLFENLFLGFELPDKWITPFPAGSGFTWDVAGAPDPQNGHEIMAYGHDAKGLLVDTWGMLGWLTYAAAAKYCVQSVGGDMYALLSPDIINLAINKAPNGLDWVQLVTDFNALGGDMPIPPPPPPPPPPPHVCPIGQHWDVTVGACVIDTPPPVVTKPTLTQVLTVVDAVFKADKKQLPQHLWSLLDQMDAQLHKGISTLYMHGTKSTDYGTVKVEEPPVK